MRNFELLYHKAKDKNEVSQWVLCFKINHTDMERKLSLGTRKAEAIKAAIRYCRGNSTVGDPISLRIKNRDGRYSDEMTYPRSADPKKSKG